MSESLRKRHQTLSNTSRLHEKYQQSGWDDVVRRWRRSRQQLQFISSMSLTLDCWDAKGVCIEWRMTTGHRFLPPFSRVMTNVYIQFPILLYYSPRTFRKNLNVRLSHLIIQAHCEPSKVEVRFVTIAVLCLAVYCRRCVALILLIYVHVFIVVSS